MPSLLAPRLKCFYCGMRSPHVKDGRTRQFTCTSCEATNHLDSVRQPRSNCEPSTLTSTTEWRHHGSSGYSKSQTTHILCSPSSATDLACPARVVQPLLQNMSEESANRHHPPRRISTRREPSAIPKVRSRVPTIPQRPGAPLSPSLPQMRPENRATSQKNKLRRKGRLSHTESRAFKSSCLQQPSHFVLSWNICPERRRCGLVGKCSLSGLLARSGFLGHSWGQRGGCRFDSSDARWLLSQRLPSTFSTSGLRPSLCQPCQEIFVSELLASVVEPNLQRPPKVSVSNPSCRRSGRLLPLPICRPRSSSYRLVVPEPTLD